MVLGVEALMSESRKYYETENAAKKYLEKNGFEETEPNSRYPWRYGLVDADIRFDSNGILHRVPSMIPDDKRHL